MALSGSILWSGSASSNSVTSGSLSPSAGSLILVLVSTVDGTNRTAATPTTGFSTGTWTKEFEQGGSTAQVAAHWAEFTSGSGTVQGGWDAGGQVKMWVIEFTGYDSADPVPQSNTYGNGTNDDTPQVTLGATPATDSWVVGFVEQRNCTAASPDSGWTEWDEITADGDTAQVQYDNDSAPATCGWSLTGGDRVACGVLEISAAAAASRRVFIIS